MNGLLQWLEDRTGLVSLTKTALYEPIPGGARWRYVWGSTLVFTFMIQVITGVVLWMAYSPSTRTAWESVYFIQYEMTGGWLVRGMHHFTANLMMVLLVLHVVQVVVGGAYRAPREFNYWTGLLLLLVMLGLSLTGYLLPWDQKGYWATSVATSLMALVPGFGSQIQQVVVGGPEYGHHTLTRFFAMHAGVLPALLTAGIAVHIYLFRRHGITAPKSDRPAQYFWPHQVWLDVVACLAVLGVVLLLCCAGMFRTPEPGAVPGDYLGAELTAPADPSEAFAAARPEWYFLFLYQLLKYFEGGTEVIGALVIPGVAFLLLFLMPVIGRTELGHRLNVVMLFGMLAAALTLTILAVREDQRSPDVQLAQHQAEVEAARIKAFVRHQGGIPWEGAISLMRQDPEIQGPKLFAQHCQSCHSHVDANGAGLAGPSFPAPAAAAGEGNGVPASSPGTPAAALGGPNLYGFASRAWLTRLLDPAHFASPEFFGATSHKEGDMAQWVNDNLASLDQESKTALQDVIVALSAEAGLASQRELDALATSSGVIARGREALTGKFSCTECHKFRETGDLGTAPDLTGYGSVEWISGIISNPAHERFYADRNDRMPAFAPESASPAQHALSADQIRMLAQWLRGDLRELGGPAEASATAP